MTGKKVKELIKKLEVYYLANKSENLYFCLLGDCTSSSKKEEEKDEEIKQVGVYEIEKLNKKYPKAGVPRFSFLYRKRTWNEKEQMYLGWERKRGLLTEFNEYLLNRKEQKKSNITRDDFLINTLDDFNLKKEPIDIKYIITLDSDTDLSLNSGIELIETMAHPLNTPEIDKEKNVVIKGHGLIQPRVGMDLETSFVSYFTQIFAGDRRGRFIHKCNIRHLPR